MDVRGQQLGTLNASADVQRFVAREDQHRNLVGGDKLAQAMTFLVRDDAEIESSRDDNCALTAGAS